MRCPRPCRARNATLFPSRVPSTIASDGSPNGVLTRISRASVSPLIEYSPLPPMIPMLACDELPVPFCFPTFVAAIHFSLSLESTALQNLVHRSKRVLLPLRHFSRQLRQPRFASLAAQRTFNQPRLQ